MEEDLDIMLSEEAIRTRVEELAGRISRDYAGKELVLICILKGAMVFATDLMRSITLPVQWDFVQASRYGASTAARHEVAVTRDIVMDIEGKHVLLVDGIIDQGETLRRLLDRYAARKPASINVAVLLDKRARRTVDVPLAYVGFEIPDAFVVGYGMDYAERYRNLPFIAAIRNPA